MNRLFRVVLLLAVALGVLVAVTAAPAQADPTGGVTVIPGTGTDLDPIRLRTSAGCPAPAGAYYATMRGNGLPPDGQVITAPIQAGMSHSIGFDVYVALVMRDYAHQNHTTLAGRYDITVYCIDRLTQERFGEFTGSLEFTSPTTYQAVGAAKPVGSPPPVRELAADGSAFDPAAASPPTGLPPAARLTGIDSHTPSPAGQRAAQRDDVTARGAPWLVLAGAVLGALVTALTARQIGKRRSS
ncbi:MAG: hypothetical protein JO364_20340 [Pseudonocardiales bacterium]|nr:hypothetical protein [Pseudonocardiales bacterium]